LACRRFQITAVERQEHVQAQHGEQREHQQRRRLVSVDVVGVPAGDQLRNRCVNDVVPQPRNLGEPRLVFKGRTHGLALPPTAISFRWRAAVRRASQNDGHNP
jgi:hypothetical protein